MFHFMLDSSWFGSLGVMGHVCGVNVTNQTSGFVRNVNRSKINTLATPAGHKTERCCLRLEI
jgi:hypothetical protein